MSSIVITCPRLNVDVAVGIETDRDSFEAISSIESTMHCPACGGEHTWSRESARLADGFTGARRPAARDPLSEVA